MPELGDTSRTSYPKKLRTNPFPSGNGTDLSFGASRLRSFLKFLKKDHPNLSKSLLLSDILAEEEEVNTRQCE